MTGKRKAKAKPAVKEAVKTAKPEAVKEVTGYNEAQSRRLSKFGIIKGGK